MDYSKFIVKEASSQDLQLFSDLCLLVFGQGYNWPPELFEKWMKTQNAHLYLMWYKTQLVGSVMTCPQFDAEGKPIIYLYWVAISPLYQGQGLGKHLLQKVISQEDTVWELGVDETNLRARRLYEKLGFVPYETLGLQPSVRSGAKQYRLQPNR